MRYTFYIVIIFGLFIESIDARPVSYPGGWTIMQMNDFNAK